MILGPTEEMRKLEEIIEPYINRDAPIRNRFKEGTPPEILEAQEKLRELSKEQALHEMFD
ncbi:MAG: hypothetical protein K6G26_03860 [Lachnospiraceae bacterium]|nr:hypothetical protein [Lachnospiraceae bacterium]